MRSTDTLTHSPIPGPPADRSDSGGERATRTRASWLTALGCAAAVGLLVGLAAGDADPFASAGLARARSDLAAPVFALPSLEGSVVDSAGLRGRVVLLNFWATWCGPCKEEMPALERLRHELAGEDFALVAVTTDQERGAIRRFVDMLHLGFPVLLDAGWEVSAAYGVRGLPTTVLIGRDGRVLARAVGPRAWDSAEVVGAIRSVIERER